MYIQYHVLNFYLLYKSNILVMAQSSTQTAGSNRMAPLVLTLSILVVFSLHLFLQTIHDFHVVDMGL